MNQHIPMDLRVSLSQSRQIAQGQTGNIQTRQAVSQAQANPGLANQSAVQNLTQLIVPSSQVQMVHNSGNTLNPGAIPHPTPSLHHSNNGHYFTSASLQSHFENTKNGQIAKRKAHGGQQQRARTKRGRKESIDGKTGNYKASSSFNSMKEPINAHSLPVYIRQQAPHVANAGNGQRNMQEMQIKLVQGPGELGQHAQQPPYQSINNSITVNVNLNSASDTNQIELAKQIVEAASQQVITAQGQPKMMEYQGMKQPVVQNNPARVIVARQGDIQQNPASINQSMHGRSSHNSRSRRPISARKHSNLFQTNNQTIMNSVQYSHLPEYSQVHQNGLVIQGTTKQASYHQSHIPNRTNRSKSQMSNDVSQTTAVTKNSGQIKTVHSRHSKIVQNLTESQNKLKHKQILDTKESREGSLLTTQVNKILTSEPEEAHSATDKKVIHSLYQDNIIDAVDLGNKSLTPQKPQEKVRVFTKQGRGSYEQNQQSKSQSSSSMAQQVVQKSTYKFGGPPVGCLLPVTQVQNDFKGFAQAGQPVQARHSGVNQEQHPSFADPRSPQAWQLDERVTLRQNLNGLETYKGVQVQVENVSIKQASQDQMYTRKKQVRPPSAKQRSFNIKNRQNGQSQGSQMKLRTNKPTHRQDNIGGARANVSTSEYLKSQQEHQRRQYHQAQSLPVDHSAGSAHNQQMHLIRQQQLDGSSNIQQIQDTQQRVMVSMGQIVSPQFSGSASQQVAKIPAFISQTLHRQPLVVLGGQVPQGVMYSKANQHLPQKQGSDQNTAHKASVPDQLQSHLYINQQEIEQNQFNGDIYNDNQAHTPEPNSRSKIQGSISVKNMHPMASLTQPLFSQRRKPSATNSNIPGHSSNSKDAPQNFDEATGQVIASSDARISDAQMTGYSSVNSYGRVGTARRKSARPKSGMPLNRAPFRPAGVAKMPEFGSPSKRNLQGRVSHTGGQKGVESRRALKLNMGQSSLKSGDDEETESEYEYGSEVSAEESDEGGQDDELQFDDEHEYSPLKLNKQASVGQEREVTVSSPAKRSTSQNVGFQGAQKPSKLADEKPQLKSSNASKNSIISQPLNKLAIQRQRKTTANDIEESGEDEEEFSDGYLDGGEEGGEEESPVRKSSSSPNPRKVTNLNSKSLQGSLPKVNEGRTSLQQQSSMKEQVLRSIDAKNEGRLGVSTSLKVIESKNALEPQIAKTISKKSLELSDSCPKEDLVRRLYQRPGLSLDNLNSKLRSISIKSKDPGSPIDKYQMGTGQFQNQMYGKDYTAMLETTEGRQQAVIEELDRLANMPDPYAPKNPFEKSMPIFLSKSPFTDRPNTVFFQYPPHINDKSKPTYKSMVHKMRDNRFKLKFKISDNVHTYNCVVNTLCFSGFTQTEGASWNIMWSAPLKPETLRHYDMYKHCNHFPGTWQLGRKDLMYRNISSQIREFGEEYNIVPRTWILPYDLGIFRKERDDTEGKRKLWILKPAASSCGRGIKILSKHSSLPKKGAYVVNEYIMKPHLFNNYKYDLRLYVLVTSFEPLTIYLYQDGLARFATQPYTTKNKKSRFAHLTNFSINKKATNYKKAGSGGEGEEENFSKWSLKTLKAAFDSHGIDYEDILGKIKDLVIKAIISVEPLLANNLNRASRNRHLCFEVFGFDVIIDQNLKPWLLEVNVLPSLSSSSPLDKRIKTSMMCDVFSTIGIVPYNKKKLEKMQENSKWKRFSGLNRKDEEDSGIYDDETYRYSSNASKVYSRKAGGNNGNVHDKDEEYSDDGDGQVGLGKVYKNMAQSQSNYMPGKIRSVKEIQSTFDFNTEEQLVIVELIEEYTRRGQFDLIFPRKQTVERYKKYFKVQRATNLLVWKWLKLSSNMAVPNPGSAGTDEKSEQSPLKDKKSQNNRFSVLKDFNLRKTCPEPIIDDIKRL